MPGKIHPEQEQAKQPAWVTMLAFGKQIVDSNEFPRALGCPRKEGKPAISSYSELGAVHIEENH
jgi:hypothetical protein